MCKLFGLTNIKRLQKNGKTLLTAEALQSIASVLAEGQRDGVGMAIKHTGGIYMHKGCDSYDSVACIGLVEDHTSESKFWTSQVKNDGELPTTGLESLIIHTRTSTNKVSYEATHPFKLSDTFCIAHNGVIDIPKKHGYPVLTPNDSEFLAYDYFHKGYLKALGDVEGYAAILAMTERGMDIYRDNHANLYISFSRALDSYLFTTVLRDATEIGKMLSSDFTIPALINDNTFLNCKFGSSKIVSSEIIEHKERVYSTHYCGTSDYYKSLGKNKKHAAKVDSFGHYNDGYEDETIESAKRYIDSGVQEWMPANIYDQRSAAHGVEK